jgi:hypothetical protein
MQHCIKKIDPNMLLFEKTKGVALLESSGALLVVSRKTTWMIALEMLPMSRAVVSLCNKKEGHREHMAKLCGSLTSNSLRIDELKIRSHKKCNSCG